MPDGSSTAHLYRPKLATILREDAVDTLCSGHPLRLWVTEGPGGAGKTLFTFRVTPEE